MTREEWDAQIAASRGIEDPRQTSLPFGWMEAENKNSRAITVIFSLVAVAVIVLFITALL